MIEVMYAAVSGPKCAAALPTVSYEAFYVNWALTRYEFLGARRFALQYLLVILIRSAQLADKMRQQ